MRKVLYLLVLILFACSKDSEDQNINNGIESNARYFTITNGDDTYSLYVGTDLLAPGDVSSKFTLIGESTEVRCWWLVNGENIYSPLYVNMKDKPNGTIENYTLRYEHTDN